MTIVSCTELNLAGKRNLSWTLMDGVTGRRTFQVVSDSSSESEYNVIVGAQSLGAPVLYDLWPGSTIGRCTGLTPVREYEDTKTWTLSAEYKTVFGQAEVDRGAFANPIDRPCVITGVSRTINLPVRYCLRTKDAYGLYPGNPVFKVVTAANSAGDFLDPPIEVASTEWELHCEKNVASLPNWFLNPAYQNGVNANDQTITIRGTSYLMPAGWAKLGNLTFSENRQENNIDFITIAWNTIYRFPRPYKTGESFVPSPWDVERMDEGTREIEWLGPVKKGQWKPVSFQGQAHPVSEPVPFNGAGKALPMPEPLQGEESDLRHFCYRPFPRVDYSVMPWS